MLGVIGPSGSGKTSLVRALVGIWPPARGTVRLDGAALDQWDPELRGPHVGYVSQAVELFDGTVAENIARMSVEAGRRRRDAGRASGRRPRHDPAAATGYDTQIGEGGALSAGQRQRIALARALYGDPFLVVLDEPNANLDSEGEAALQQAIRDLKARGAIVILIAHRPSALAALRQGPVSGQRHAAGVRTARRGAAQGPGAATPARRRRAGNLKVVGETTTAGVSDERATIRAARSDGST